MLHARHGRLILYLVKVLVSRAEGYFYSQSLLKEKKNLYCTWERMMHVYAIGRDSVKSAEIVD